LLGFAYHTVSLLLDETSTCSSLSYYDAEEVAYCKNQQFCVSSALDAIAKYLGRKFMNGSCIVVIIIWLNFSFET